MKDNRITVKANKEEFEKVRDFIENTLKSRKVPNELVQENCLVFEELFLRIIEQY